MAGFDFNEFKKKAVETAGNIADKSAEVARMVAEKAEFLARKAKLKADIAGERSSLRRKYQELGKLYYNKYKGSLDPDFAQTEAEIELSMEKIAAKQEELETLRTEAEAAHIDIDEEPDIQVDVEEEEDEPAGDQETGEAEETADDGETDDK